MSRQARSTAVCHCASVSPAFISGRVWAKMTSRALTTSAPSPSEWNAPRTSAARPPCLPNPGTRIHACGIAARIASSCRGQVAPTTAPIAP